MPRLPAQLIMLDSVVKTFWIVHPALPALDMDAMSDATSSTVISCARRRPNRDRR
jgi:hypothetical protein